MIKVNDLKKYYRLNNNVIRAVDGISYRFDNKTFYAIVGRSGSGKSTFLRMLGGIISPDSGEIYVDEEKLVSKNEKQLADYRNNKVGIIFQDFCLEQRFTCLENVLIPTYPNRKNRRKAQSRAENILECIGLKERINHKINELSGGEKQRVAIARALINEPDIILADEPTGNLDSNSGGQIIEILSQIAQDDKTVIMVTHNIEDAKKTDVTLTFNDGKITEPNNG